jgi:hypothetical protein
MQRANSKFNNMLGNTNLKFFRPVLEDKFGKFKWKLLVRIVEVTNLVVGEDIKFIKDTLMEKYDILLDFIIFLID